MTICATPAPHIARTRGTPITIAHQGTPRLGGALRGGRDGVAGAWLGAGSGGAAGRIRAPQPVQNCVPGSAGRPHLVQKLMV